MRAVPRPVVVGCGRSWRAVLPDSVQFWSEVVDAGWWRKPSGLERGLCPVAARCPTGVAAVHGGWRVTPRRRLEAVLVSVRGGWPLWTVHEFFGRVRGWLVQRFPLMGGWPVPTVCGAGQGDMAGHHRRWRSEWWQEDGWRRRGWLTRRRQGCWELTWSAPASPLPRPSGSRSRTPLVLTAARFRLWSGHVGWAWPAPLVGLLDIWTLGRRP